MISIELRFPASRYHANPWGRHVNEGVAEWPPSPYRLVRALYDAWKRKCGHLTEAQVRQVLSILAAEAPDFWLPKVVSAHTRSYLSSNDYDHSKKSLIFDAFVAMDRSATCAMQWPNSELGLEDAAVLSELLTALNYLGRSESWIEARLVFRKNGGTFWCKQKPGDEPFELIEIACPIEEEKYKGEIPWLSALTDSTSRMTKDKRDRPLAMRRLTYARQRGAVVPWLSSTRVENKMHFTALRLSFAGRVLPVATETIRVAEEIRCKFMGAWKRVAGQRIPEYLHGKSEDGDPLEGHRHLYVLPQANAEGRVEGALLLCKEGFDQTDIQAVLKVRELHRFDRVPIRVMATWRGQLEDLAIRPKVRIVESSTPFVPPRNWRKGRGELLDYVAAEAKRECLNHGLEEPDLVKVTGERCGKFEPILYRRSRKDDRVGSGFALRMTFRTEVSVPFSIGYGAHFGMGQFHKAKQ